MMSDETPTSQSRSGAADTLNAGSGESVVQRSGDVAPPRTDRGGDRRSLRLGAILVLVGELVYAVATPLHPGGADPIDQFSMYAESQSWGGIHAVQFASWVLVAFGLLALAHGLDAGSTMAGLVKRFGSACAVAIIPITGVVYAVDGVALKYAANAWVGASPAERPALFAALQGIRGVEWGLRAYAAYVIALSLILIAISIVATAQVPRIVGYLMGLTGLVYGYQAVSYGAGDTALSDHSVVGSVSYYVVVLVWIWAIWLLVSASRTKEPGHLGR